MINAVKQLTNKPAFHHVKRHWLTFSFFFGFILDNITLNRVDQLFDNIVLFSYVVLSMVSILFLYAGVAGKLPESWIHPVRKYSPLVTQFAFGGLMSGMLIFYGRSGAWAQSWPFLLVILAVIYGNETIKDRATRLVFNLSIFFIGLFSYVVLVIPVLTGYMGAWVFVGSGLVALLLVHFFILTLRRIVPNFIELNLRMIIFSIGSIFVVFNFLYFTNIIPPIPLSLKDIGIYHSVVRFDNGDYQLKYEEGQWWQFWKRSDSTFHPSPGGSVFCFAKVFAPTRLNTEIYHRWEYYDEASGQWQQYARLSYPISGGRNAGFRGYTLIENSRAGSWRCTVETGRGQALGRETFVIDPTTPPDTLTTRIE